MNEEVTQHQTALRAHEETQMTTIMDNQTFYSVHDTLRDNLHRHLLLIGSMVILKTIIEASLQGRLEIQLYLLVINFMPARVGLYLLEETYGHLFAERKQGMIAAFYLNRFTERQASAIMSMEQKSWQVALFVAIIFEGTLVRFILNFFSLKLNTISYQGKQSPQSGFSDTQSGMWLHYLQSSFVYAFITYRMVFFFVHSFRRLFKNSMYYVCSSGYSFD